MSKPTYADIIAVLPEMLLLELDTIRDAIDAIHPRPDHPLQRLRRAQGIEEITDERRKLIVRALEKLKDGKASP